jgi:hypothetical protein
MSRFEVFQAVREFLRDAAGAGGEDRRGLLGLQRRAFRLWVTASWPWVTIVVRVAGEDFGWWDCGTEMGWSASFLETTVG